MNKHNSRKQMEKFFFLRLLLFEARPLFKNKV
jgi:hypothetical protein